MKLKNKYFFVGALLGAVFLGLSFSSHTAFASTFSFISKDGSSVSMDTSGGNTVAWSAPRHLTVNGQAYSTNAPYCDGDYAGMYTCNDNSNSASGFSNTFTWYWPTDDGSAVAQAVNDKCVSAIVVRTGDDGSKILGSDSNHRNKTPQFYVVNLVKDAADNDCKFVTQKGYNNYGGFFEGTHHYDDDDGSGAESNTKGQGFNSYSEQFWRGASYSSGQVHQVNTDKSSLFAFATAWGWNDPTHIQAYPGNTVLTYLDPGDTGDSAAIKAIKSKLSGATKKYDTGYLYYTNDSCNDGSKVKAFMAVDPHKPGEMHLLHFGASGNYVDDWNVGNGPKHCIIGVGDGDDTYELSAAILYGGSSATTDIGLGDTANAYGGNCVDSSGKTVTTLPPPGTGTCPNGTTKACNANLTLDTNGNCGSANNSSTDGSQSCESNAGVLGWILCAIIDTFADAVSGIYTFFIVPLMQAPTLATNSTQGSKLYTAWSTFRVFGNIFLVIVVLITVFGESIGGGMFDAYTVKKVLPRILIGAIAINLSFYVTALFIDFSNIIGNGIRLLITGAFGISSADSNHFNIGTFGGGAAGTGGIAISGAAIAAVVAVALKGKVIAGKLALKAFYSIFTGVLPALLLLFLAIMAVLALRLGLIYALVLASPIAFALWVLPNTEKYFKKWFELLQTTAMVFPIVSALFGLSIVLAQANLWAGGAAGGVTALVSYLISLVIVIMPLVLIPFSFKIAGGLLGRAYELANGGAQRGMTGYKKWRQEKLDERMRAGNLFKGADPKSRRGKLNEALAASGRLTARDFSPTRSKKDVLSRLKAKSTSDELHHLDEALKDQETVAGIANDDINQAALHGKRSKQDAYNYLMNTGKYTEEDARAGAEFIAEMRRKHGVSTFNRAAAVRNPATGTGFKDGGPGEMIQALLDVSEGDTALFADLLGKARESAKQGNRPDLYGIGYTDSLAIAMRLKKGEITQGEANELLKENAAVKRSMGEQITQRESSVVSLVGGNVQATNDTGQKLYYDDSGQVTTSETNAAGEAHEVVVQYQAGTLHKMIDKNQAELEANQQNVDTAHARGDTAAEEAFKKRAERLRREEARLIASIADGQDNVGRASPENRAAWAAFMNQKIKVMKPQTEVVEVPVLDLNGQPAIDRNTNMPVPPRRETRPILDASGKQVYGEVEMTRAQQLEERRYDPLVLEQRREYANAQAADAARLAGGAGEPPGGPPATPPPPAP